MLDLLVLVQVDIIQLAAPHLTLLRSYLQGWLSIANGTPHPGCHIQLLQLPQYPPLVLNDVGFIGNPLAAIRAWSGAHQLRLEHGATVHYFLVVCLQLGQLQHQLRVVAAGSSQRVVNLAGRLQLGLGRQGGHFVHLLHPLHVLAQQWAQHVDQGPEAGPPGGLVLKHAGQQLD